MQWKNEKNAEIFKELCNLATICSNNTVSDGAAIGPAERIEITLRGIFLYL